MTAQPQNRRLQGLMGAFLAYLCWGMMPIYWSLTKGAYGWEVIAHRCVWSSVVLVIMLFVLGRSKELWQTLASLATVRRSTLVLLVFAAAFAAVNWWINVLAAQIDRITELGLGMFMTPLFSVAFGVLLFKEKLPLIKQLSLIPGFAGLAVQALNYGRIPWIALGVSITWAAYGAFKKKIPLDPWMSNTTEGLILLPFAVGFMVYLMSTGQSHFMTGNPVLTWSLLGTGVVTTIPMLAFAYSTICLPLNVLGFCQYLNPVFTIAVGVIFLGEPFSQDLVLPLALIFVSTVMFTYSEIKDALSSRK